MNNNPSNKDQAFILYLSGILEQSDRSASRAAMANLRSGLSKPFGAAYKMDPYILKKLPENASPLQEFIYYLVASLFAYWHQGKDKSVIFSGNMGKSLRQLVNQDSKNRDVIEKRIEKRLNAILESSIEDLEEYLRQIVSLLKSKEIPVDWAQLLHDIQLWNHDSRFIQHEWAKGFWVEN
jgi:CRISPR system Cascade subunit CasB